MFDIEPWLNLALRWLHVTAGIAWIGSSFYFIWLDNHLRRAEGLAAGVAGELWSVHGGGFYHQQKYLNAPAQLPADLHWFKWEAYTTWISGFFLLALIYYWGASLYLIDAGKWPATPMVAVAASLAILVIGWLVYDRLAAKFGAHNGWFGLVWFGVLVAVAWLSQQLFAARAAYVELGALIGTVMAANVFFIIIPNQKKSVAKMLAGETPDPRWGQQAKQRSLHNNYMTLPVLFIMTSSHYPMTYGHAQGWLALAGLGAVGWLVRHFFNLRHKGKSCPWCLVGAAALFLGVAALVSQHNQRGADGASFAAARAVIDRHCVACHAANPRHDGFDAPPLGLDLTDPAAIVRSAAKIRDQAVLSAVMPLGNETGMTADERALLGAWIAQGAKP